MEGFLWCQEGPPRHQESCTALIRWLHQNSAVQTCTHYVIIYSTLFLTNFHKSDVSNYPQSLRGDILLSCLKKQTWIKQEKDEREREVRQFKWVRPSLFLSLSLSAVLSFNVSFFIEVRKRTKRGIIQCLNKRDGQREESSSRKSGKGFVIVSPLPVSLSDFLSLWSDNQFYFYFISSSQSVYFLSKQIKCSNTGTGDWAQKMTD